MGMVKGVRRLQVAVLVDALEERKLRDQT